MVQPVSAALSLPLAPPRLTVFDTGAEQCPQGQLPVAGVLSDAEARNVRNPLQYMPVVGMIYRQATGETIPPAFQIAGSIASSAAMGGPLGIVGSVLLNFVSELARLGPDTSRPPVPMGMDATGSEAGVRTGLPGNDTPAGGYTTLATAMPDFLGGPTSLAADGTPIRQVLAAYEAGTLVGHG